MHIIMNLLNEGSVRIQGPFKPHCGTYLNGNRLST